MLTSLKKFLAVSDNSIQGYISQQEMYRSLLTSVSSGTAMGALILVLQGVLSNVGIIFPNPATASIATVALTLVIDLLRRQSQGNVPAPSPTPAPAPPPAPAPAPASTSV